jgi:hypothetical protein
MANDTPRRRGRPPLDPTGRPVAAVQVKLTADDYDQVHKIASARGVTVPEVVRRAVRRALKHPLPY